jgi:hypothetical protein
VAGPSLENWGLKHSRAILKHQVTFFGLKLFQHGEVPMMLFYTLRPFQWLKIVSIKARMKKLCLPQVDLSCCAKVMPPTSYPSQPLLLMHMGITTYVISRRL